MQDLNSLETELLAAVGSAQDLAALDAVRVAALGKKGSVTELLKGLGALSPDERRGAGAAINLLKDKIGGAIDAHDPICFRRFSERLQQSRSSAAVTLINRLLLDPWLGLNLGLA